MWVKIFKVLFTLTCSICIANGQNNYELEFIDEGVYKPCEQYPDKFIDRLFDVSNLHFEQTEEGTLLVKGYAIAKITIDQPLEAVAESFKKERGTWQPTIFTQKRLDFCKSIFDASESWHSYLKNTPKEQQKCPITEGQRIDFDINEANILSLPSRNAEGEYNIHLVANQNGGDMLFCIDIAVMAHKV